MRFAEAVVRWTAMVAHRAELVQEISRLAVEQAGRAAAEELVTVLAHDLRNLMAPLDARLHALRRRAEADERRDDVADLQAAQQVLGRLGNLVSDILDVARIEHGLFVGLRRPLDVRAIVEDVAQTLSTPAHPIDVRVKATGPLVVAGDEPRLRQCLENLLVNAIQKSPKDTGIDVRVSSETREDGEWVLIEVRDHGPSVPNHLLPRIFERYVTSAGREGGLGLGLYLARQVAVMHGRDLRVDADTGTGGRFIVELPCYARADSPPTPTSRPGRADGAPQR